MPAIAGSIALSAPYKPINMVKAFSVILKGRNRLLRITLLLNKFTNCRASGSAITHLESFLQHKFGPTAVGVLVGDCVYKNDEEMMRDSLIRTNDCYYVLYEDYTPPYAECLVTPPMYRSSRPTNCLHCHPHRAHDGEIDACACEDAARPGEDGVELPDYASPLVKGYLRPAYFEELVYYPTIPLVKKTFHVKLSFGRRATITLSNHCTDHADNFRHELYLKAGYKAQGIQTPDGTIYRNDEILFNDEIEDGGTYKLVRGTGYAINAPAQERAPAPPPVVSSQHQQQQQQGQRQSVDGLWRISSNASRSLHLVASRRSSTSSRELRNPSIRVK